MSDTFLFNSVIYENLYGIYLGFINHVNYRWGDYELGENQPKIRPLSSLQLQKFIKTALWGSLRQEEGKFHNFSLSIIEKERCIYPYVFDETIPFDETHLSKLAPAFDSSENFIGVSYDTTENLEVWGFASISESRSVEVFCEVIAPGQIIISFQQYGMRYFAAFITGTETKAIKSSEFRDWIIPGYKNATHQERVNYKFSTIMCAVDYKHIAFAMRSHARGGTLLIVPEESNWRDSIRTPIPNIGKGYEKIKVNLFCRNLILDKEEELLTKLNIRHRDNEKALESAIKSLKVIGNLTAIDGATVISNHFDILAFGVKIDTKSKPETVSISTPFEDEPSKETKLADLGGTRHQSAAQFVFEQKDSIAIVASQDGRLSVMKWIPEKNMVCVIRPAEFGLL